MAQLFRPLMERVVADAPPTTAPWPPTQIPRPFTLGPSVILPAFGDLLRAFLREFANARSGPFQKIEPLRIASQSPPRVKWMSPPQGLVSVYE